MEGLMQIEKDKIVSFRYTMKNGRGEIMENTTEKSPTIYLHGCDEILSALQNQLEGLLPGERKNVFLLKTSGLVDDDFTFEIIIDEVRDATPEELVLGYPLQLDVEKCEADCSCYTNEKNPDKN